MTIHLDYRDKTALQLARLTGYKGRKFQVRIQERVHLSNTYWDGGTKHDYIAVDLATMKTVPLPSVSPFDVHFDRDADPVNFRDVTLPVGVGMIELTNFGGKQWLTLYVHPENAPMLEAKGPELTENQKIVLYAIRSRKSSYAGIKDYRKSEAVLNTPIMPEEYDHAKQELIDAKLLNKAGALTPEGRNAVDGVNDWPHRLTLQEQSDKRRSMRAVYAGY